MKIKPGIYRHYKGNKYEVIGLAQHSETKEELVVYKSIKNKDEVWVRPLSMFTEEVDKPDYQGLRFKLIQEINN